MASYRVMNTTQWTIPERYDEPYEDAEYRRDDGDYSTSYPAPHHIRRSSMSVHRQSPQYNYDDDDRRVDYTREARYGSSYRSNDPSAYPPELSTSPSISSGSSIETPSIGSYQPTGGSYFTLPIKGHEMRYEDTRLEYPLQYRDIGDEVRDAGSLFSNMKLEDNYSRRMEPGPYDSPDPLYLSRDYARRYREEIGRYEVDDRLDEADPTIPTRSRRHSIISSKSQLKQQQQEDWLTTPSTEKTEDEIRFEVEDIFNDAENKATGDEWIMESNLRPGITSCGKEAVRVLRESEAINKDLRAVAAALAAFRAKRKQRPSFSGRSTSSSAKSKSSSNVFYTVRHKVDDWDRHHRERNKHR